MKMVRPGDALSISVSVVSHGQMSLIKDLLQDIKSHCNGHIAELLLTINVEEPMPVALDSLPFRVKVIRNLLPKGFGENHNQAFHQSTGNYFCVLNPDIRFDVCPFSALLVCLQDTRVGVAVPLVVNAQGQLEDSARHFPSPISILKKLFFQPRELDFEFGTESQPVDWAAGMFLLFTRQVFQRISGFDERYFLYYEDVDICARLRLAKYQVMVCPDAQVVHHAQRTSRRRLRYLVWHLRSMARFFLSSVYQQIKKGVV